MADRIVIPRMGEMVILSYRPFQAGNLTYYDEVVERPAVVLSADGALLDLEVFGRTDLMRRGTPNGVQHERLGGTPESGMWRWPGSDVVDSVVLPTLADVLAPTEPVADQAEADARSTAVAAEMLQREPLEKAELDAFFDVEGAANLSEETNDDGPE